jgi:hypothetical protein
MGGTVLLYPSADKKPNEAVSLMIQKPDTAITVDQMVNQWIDQVRGGYPANEIVVENTTIGGLPAIRMTLSPSHGWYPGHANIKVFIKKKDVAYAFEYNRPAALSAQQTYFSIINSFQLAAPVSSKNNWSTYSNSRYSYSIQYPTAWTADNSHADSDPVQVQSGSLWSPKSQVSSSDLSWAGGLLFLFPVGQTRANHSDYVVVQTFRPDPSITVDGMFNSLIDTFSGPDNAYILSHITVGGLSAIKITNNQLVEYFVKGRSRIYDIQLHTEGVFVDAQLRKDMEQIAFSLRTQ